MGRLSAKVKPLCRLFSAHSVSCCVSVFGHLGCPEPPTPTSPPPSSLLRPHTTRVTGLDQTGGGRRGGGRTSSDLANKHSINGAVERVTHASQNLLRSNSPLQFPLHWADPQAAGPKHRPRHRPPRCQVTRWRGSGPLPGASARKRCQC